MNTDICPQCDRTPREAPSEEYTISSNQGLVRFLLSVPLTATIVAAFVTAILGVLGVSLAVVGRLPADRVARVPLGLMRFFGFAWCFVAVVAVPLSLFWCLLGHTRRVWVEGRRLQMRIGWRQATFDLDQCSWSVLRGLAGDSAGPYFGSARPRLVVAQDRRSVALGFSEEAAARWIEYFQATGVHRLRKTNWLRFLVAGVIAAVVGGVIGVLLEPLLPLIGGPANLQGRLVFLGVLDGVIAILYRQAIRVNRQFRRNGRLAGMSVVMVMFAAIALQTFGNTWQIFGPNAAIGAVLGWMLFRGGEEEGQLDVQPENTSS